MRYFLDTEYNGSGGELISIALVPEFGDQDFYAVLPLPEKLHPWVERNVLPYLHSVPEGLRTAPWGPAEAAHALESYLAADDDPLIVADWPEDIAHFCSLMVTGPGEVIHLPRVRFALIAVPGFSCAENSRVPHNALHDARALRSFLAPHPIEREA